MTPSSSSLCDLTNVMGLLAVGGEGGDLHGLMCGLVPWDCAAGLGKDKMGVLESWGSIEAVLVASWASELAVLSGCRFILTAGGEFCCRGRRRTGLS